MRLGKKQELFSFLIAQHILWLNSKGYSVRFGDTFRDSRVHGEYGVKKSYSSRNSNHKLKLAGDLNLFRGGEFLQATEQHKESGEKWQSRHKLCEWGGSGNRKDGNHYSLSHNGGW